MSDTCKGEMQLKVAEYFSAGNRLVWLVDPESRTARVYTRADQQVQLDENGILVGGDLLLGFQLRLGDWLDKVEPAGGST